MEREAAIAPAAPGRTVNDNRVLIEQLFSLASVQLIPERLDSLLAQANDHFGLLQTVLALDPEENEPAAEFKFATTDRKGT